MTGQLLWLKPEEPPAKHTRLRLFCGEKAETSWELRFIDIRTFGKIWWIPPTAAPETIVSGLQKLGPEPFSEDFSLDYLAGKLQTRRCPIKSLLLDQSLVAGIGNIYADEALFKSGIQPTVPASTLSRQQVASLRLAIVEVLQTAIEQGGTTFSDFRSLTGLNGNYGGSAWVYGRYRQPCRLCQTPIARVKLAGRSSHYCPRCQG
jgi:formamidopyrimidine-DNA glycosylase